MKNRRGFTLIEILIVTVVLGVLATIAIPRYNKARRYGYIAAVKSDLENMALSQETHFDDNSQYASDVATLEYVLSQGVDITMNEVQPGGWGATGTHVAIPGFHCGIYYGSATAASGDPAPVPGVVECTVP